MSVHEGKIEFHVKIGPISLERALKSKVNVQEKDKKKKRVYLKLQSCASYLCDLIGYNSQLTVSPWP